MINYSIVDKDYVGLNKGIWTEENNPKIVDLVSFVPLYVRASQILASSDLRELQLLKSRNEALYYDQVSDDPDDYIESLYDAQDFVDVANYENRAENVLNAQKRDFKTKSTNNTIESVKTSLEASNDSSETKNLSGEVTKKP